MWGYSRGLLYLSAAPAAFLGPWFLGPIVVLIWLDLLLIACRRRRH
jgi:hypothetical protein